MENPGRLIGQIAADANNMMAIGSKLPRVTERRVKMVLYLTGLAHNGRTVEQCARLLKVEPRTIKRLARFHLIDFTDYKPFAKQRDAGEVVCARIPLNLAA